MALSKVSDPTLEVVKDHFLEWCSRKDRNTISLLIVGKTGVGKSSLVNALVGRQQQKAKEGNDKFHCTDAVTSYDIDNEGVKIRVWDTPGLRDDDDEDEEEDGIGRDKKYLAEMQNKIKEELDLVIFCLRMDDTRFQRDDKQTFKILTDCFGKELWKNAVIALTFANKVDDPAGGDREAYFRQDLAKWQDQINSFLSEKIKLDPERVQSLRLVPTGYYLSLTVLPNGEKWLSKFWIACYKVAKRSSAFNLYRINTGRIIFHGSEKLAAACCGSKKVAISLGSETLAVRVCGGSELVPTSPWRETLAVVCGGSEVVPGANDSEIPPIDLNKEEQDSFWESTCKMFKEYCLQNPSIVLGAVLTFSAAILQRLLL